jgi:hypothetical protein
MITYRALYDRLEGDFDGCEVRHVGRESNVEADDLANIGSKCLPRPPRVFFETIFERSIKTKPTTKKPTLAIRSGAADEQAPEDEPSNITEATSVEQIAQIITADPIWTKPYIAYLIHGEKPDDIIHCCQIVRRSKSFTIINGDLYRRSTSGVLQRCIAKEDGKAILKDIHEGTCRHHACSRTLVAKAFRSGFYWPTALENAKNLIDQCDTCERFGTRPHAPASELHTIPLAWPFAQWGLDQVGPLPKSARGGHTFLLVVVDKFSKWIKDAQSQTQKRQRQ